MKTITLSENVMVSDPCYSPDTWCQTKLKNVYPGEYNVDIQKSDEGDWGTRVAVLQVVHKGYIMECEDETNWEQHSECGVDSGQCGIFCMTSYRNDEIVPSITTPESDFSLGNYRNDTEGGDRWYEAMCKFTLSNEQSGVYDTGVVTSSGIGDGMYPMDVVYNDDEEIVGIRITYLGNSDKELLGDDEDEEDYEGQFEDWDNETPNE